MNKFIFILVISLLSTQLFAKTGAYYSKTLKKCIEFNIDDGTIPAYKTLGACKNAHQVKHTGNIDAIPREKKLQTSSVKKTEKSLVKKLKEDNL